MNHPLIAEIERLLKPLNMKVSNFSMRRGPYNPGLNFISIETHITDAALYTVLEKPKDDRAFWDTSVKPVLTASCDGMGGHLNDCYCFEDESPFDQRD